MEQGLYNALYTLAESDHRDIKQIWKGANPETCVKIISQFMVALR